MRILGSIVQSLVRAMLDTWHQVDLFVTLPLFAAAGIVRLEKPSAVEQGVTRAASFGAGVRFGLSDKDRPSAATLTMEYARGEAPGKQGDNRFNLRFIATF